MVLFQQPLLSFSNPSINRAVDPVFTEDYSSSTGWTLSSNMNIGSGVLNYVAVPRTPENSWKSLGVTLSDTLWFANFDYNESADTAADNFSWLVFCLSAGTAEPRNSSQDMIGLGVRENLADYAMQNFARDGATITNSVGTSNLSQSTQYYPRLLRNSATEQEVQVYSDSARTTTAVSSVTHAIASTVGNSLTTLQHASEITTNSQNVSAVMDNVNIFDAVAP